MFRRKHGLYQNQRLERNQASPTTILSAHPVVTIQLGLGDGQGNPGEPYTVNIGEPEPADLALTDMNRDGHLDLVTLNKGNETVTVILGNGDGTFLSPATYAPHAPANFIAEVFKVVDVSGDGAPEVIVTSTVYGHAESHLETTLLINDGAAALTRDQTINRFGRSGENIAAADLDNDGNVDLATASHLLINQLPTTIGTPHPGDLNGDGHVDLDDYAILMPFIGGPEVTEPPPGSDPILFDAADLDGDGDVDIHDFSAFQRALGGS